jgi:hypothetical protein
MTDVERAIRDLVIANRILAKENVVDAYGHVSIRHPLRPDRYLLSRSLSPEFVTPEDIIEFTLDGEPVSDKRPPYLDLRSCVVRKAIRFGRSRTLRLRSREGRSLGSSGAMERGKARCSKSCRA